MQMIYLYASDFPFKNFRWKSLLNTKKCLGKELWCVLVVDKSTDHDKPHFVLFSVTISTSKKCFLFRAREECELKKACIARHIDASSVVWLGLVMFWLVCSEHAPARVQPLYGAGRKDSSGTGLCPCWLISSINHIHEQARLWLSGNSRESWNIEPENSGKWRK